METVFTRLLTAALLGIFIENAAFERAMGVNVLLYAARKKENLIGIFIGAIYVTTASSAIICFLDRYFSSWEYADGGLEVFPENFPQGKKIRPFVGI